MAETFGAQISCKYKQLDKASILILVTSGKVIDFNAIIRYKPFTGISLHPIRVRSIVPYPLTFSKASRIALNSLSPASEARLSLIAVLPSAISCLIAEYISSALFAEMTVASRA